MARRGGLRLGSDGKPLQGRKPGSKNKTTIEREDFEQQQAAIATAENAAAPKPKKMAKTVLEEFMLVAAGYAARYQPTYDADGNVIRGDEAKFKQWANFTLQWAKELAPYQSPTFKAVALQEVPPPPAATPGPPAIEGGKSSNQKDAANAYLRLVRSA